MKVGIITFHRTTNYGATLQVYALQKTLGKFVDEVEIIDYRNMNIYSYYDPRYFSKLPLKTKIGKILRYKYNIETYNCFLHFWKQYLRFSPECTDIDQLCEVEKQYGAVICGSDQVWNPRAIFQDFNAFLLGTVECKKIAYAASAGAVSLWEPYLKIYWELLHRFDSISVREEAMKVPTEHLSQKEVSVVLDPTLLLEQKEWVEIENKEFVNTLPQNGYILVYFLGKNPEVVQAVRELQRQTGLPVISLGRKLSGAHIIRPIAGPDEYLALFHHASFVLTSSFHGTVFSIQYNRPFLVFGNGAYNSRMNTLLRTLDLQERMINGDLSDLWKKINRSIDWEKVQKCCNVERKRSLDFLENALKEKRGE